MLITDIEIARSRVMDEILKGTEELEVSAKFYVIIDDNKHFSTPYVDLRVKLEDDFFIMRVPTNQYIAEPLKIWEAINTYGIEKEYNE